MSDGIVKEGYQLKIYGLTDNMIISAYATSGLHLLQRLFFSLPILLVLHVFLGHSHKKQAYAMGVGSGDSARQVKNGIENGENFQTTVSVFDKNKLRNLSFFRVRRGWNLAATLLLLLLRQTSAFTFN